MNLLRLAVGMVFVLLMLAVAPAQERIKDLGNSLDKKFENIRKDEKEKQEANAREFHKEMQRLRLLWDAVEAELLLADNNFAEAIEKAEKSVRELEKTPLDQLTPQERLIYREALLQLGRFRAAMGDQEQAVQRAGQAVKVHELIRAASQPVKPTDRLTLLGPELAVAQVYVASGQTQQATARINRVIEDCRQMPRPFNDPQSNGLLAEALLLKSMLANLVENYPEAEKLAADVLEVFRKQYPQSTTHPDGHPKQAAALVMLAMAQVGLGQTQAPLDSLKEAEKILGPPDQAVKGKRADRATPVRAELYRIRGWLYLKLQKEEEALSSIETARQMFLELFPSDKYPRSHPALIQALTSLADLMNQLGQGKLASNQAVKLATDALEECRKRYHEQPHEQVVSALLCHGRCLRSSDQLADAQKQFIAALAMAGQLYDKSDHPQAHLQLALCQMHLGSFLGRLPGRYEQARQLLEDAQAIYQRVAPGHPYLFATASYLGLLALQHGDAEGSLQAFARALETDQRQLRLLPPTLRDVEVLTFNQPRQMALHGYLTASYDVPALDEQSFGWVWSAANAASLLAHARHAALRLAGERDPSVQRLLTELADVSAQLSQGLKTARGDLAFTKLMQEQDRLKTALGRLSSQTAGLLQTSDLGPHDLAARLPRGSAFIEFIRYADLSSQPEVQDYYAAFLVLPGRAPQRIELGPARPIDKAITNWRKAVDDWSLTDPLVVQDAKEKKSSAQAAVLRGLIWERIDKRLPAETRLLLLAAAGDLARVPFAALPGAQPETVLLEQFSIGYVPNGPFLLQRLVEGLRRRSDGLPRSSDYPDSFLALGAVAFDPPGANSQFPYRDLPGSRGVIELAQTRPQSRTTHILKEHDATVAALRRTLPEVEEAHLATHAKFDEKGLEAERKQWEEKLRTWTPDGTGTPDRKGLGRRFPLSYVWLALAGANQPNRAGQDEHNLLTGEAIPYLALHRLRLLVLDGCETGLGEYTAGEGVQGFQRAFHMAGCPNVVATLWRLNDSASQALMHEFYRHLWQNRLPTLEALRQAQLAIYRDPARMTLDSLRRAVGEERMAPDGRDIVLPRSAGTRQHSHVQLWAAYVHSGIGHPFVDPEELAALVAGLPVGDTTPVPSAAGMEWLWLAVAGLLALTPLGWLLLRRQRRRASTGTTASLAPPSTDPLSAPN